MQGILTDLLKQKAFSLTKMSTGKVIAASLGIEKVSIRLHSTAQRHLMEDGSSQADSRTIHPTELVVEVYCPSRDVLNEVNEALMTRDSLYKINTRGLVIQNLMCLNEAVHQSGEVISATPIQLTFRQVMVENPFPIVFIDSQDSSIVDRGLTSLQDIAATARGLFDKATGLTNILS